ncbi:hypothetical protein CPB84DRAFT_1854706 [Gymnopilus junonius]|uniref:Uncharacterized protein n=1 Tax=Gymnopilus junonius TaxID=109634 RepID=A0A9P5N7C9_GYMJU|nr:hypothetical protein CPB84DRAFT_1854706 [Gymnopilus junonius]
MSTASQQPELTVNIIPSTSFRPLPAAASLGIQQGLEHHNLHDPYLLHPNKPHYDFPVNNPLACSNNTFAFTAMPLAEQPIPSLSWSGLFSPDEMAAYGNSKNVTKQDKLHTKEVDDNGEAASVSEIAGQVTSQHYGRSTGPKALPGNHQGPAWPGFWLQAGAGTSLNLYHDMTKSIKHRHLTLTLNTSMNIKQHPPVQSLMLQRGSTILVVAVSALSTLSLGLEALRHERSSN